MRYSLSGGGSDLPKYLSKFGYGTCLTTTLNQSVYVATHASAVGKHRLVYSEIEEVTTIPAIRHRIMREVFQYFNLREYMEVFSIADLPAKGTGLGASSAFCNALIASVSRYQNLSLSNLEIARITSEIEIIRAGTESGYQDQYASALGGIKLLNFDYQGLESFESPFTPIEEESVIDWLNTHTIFLKVPGERNSSEILSVINFEDPNVQYMQNQITEMVPFMVSALRDRNLKDYAACLEQNWNLKKNLNPLASNEVVEDLYRKALELGALGGKLLGAGASGYLALAVNDSNNSLRQLLQDGPHLKVSGQKMLTKEI